MGGPYWPLVSFSLITFLIEVIYIPAQKIRSLICIATNNTVN